MESACARDSSLPTQSTTTSAPPVRRARRLERAGTAAHGPHQLVGLEGGVGAELVGESALIACLAPTSRVRRRVTWAKAATVHSPSVPAPSTATVWQASAAREGGVHGTGGGLDHHGVVIVSVVGHGMELGLVRDEAPRRPASAGVGAEPDLQPRGEMAEGDALASARAALGARRDRAG